MPHTLKVSTSEPRITDQPGDSGLLCLLEWSGDALMKLLPNPDLIVVDIDLSLEGREPMRDQGVKAS